MPFLILIIVIGIVGAISFLRMNNNVESEDGQNASDFDIKEIK
jgi:hypothetical protein